MNCQTKLRINHLTSVKPVAILESFDTDVYSDFARLLATSSNVESANVPQAMQEVANQIVKDTGSEKFSSLTVEEAEEWLQTSTSLAGYKFRQFLKRHGHRCLKEFDLRSMTWGMNPKLLVKLLQNLASATKEEIKKGDDSIDRIFSQLRVPLNFMSKCLLKFVAPQCRRAVRGREAGKSLSIKSFDHWRKGFRLLAKQMVSEGRLPDPDLIFFLTLDEIKDLLETRSPSIISRANYRKKLYPVLDKFKFPEIMKGFPKPINDEEESADKYEFIADLTMKGIPVSQGVTKGYARVAMTLEEAADLKFGLAIHQNDHQARRTFVEWAQNEIAVVPDFHKQILFSDEAHFWLNDYDNKQNCRIWSEANPQVYVETPLHPEKLTVWCSLWAVGIHLQKR
ncbi:phosphoenolpyruvate synthase [Trichonephila clavipes]|nr:phosphoenolpyruvate synthase [Trichonephila clavipes]